MGKKPLHRPINMNIKPEKIQTHGNRIAVSCETMRGLANTEVDAHSQL